ncbi:MAG: dihydrolipoamide acetyltransferase family protein [Thermodesulfobacteriota bacterium]|nr:dihydrolipoamide acetyltransferase family protein [Thermodesulfobacteriota bacterium]
MAVEIVMPKLSDTMEEGKILRWLKKEGDYVTKGEVVAEIETDKADMELEAFSSGILSKIFFKEGETVRVGAVIALLGEGGGGVSTEEKPRSVAGEPVSPPDKPPVVFVAETDGEPCCTVPLDDEEEAPAAEIKKEAPKVSPAARKLIEEKGIDTVRLKGSGPEGRIGKKDVEKYLKEATEATATTQTPPPVESGAKEATEDSVELSRMRATIARRMTKSKQTIPHFYVTRECDMGESVKLIDSLNLMGEEEEKITHNDLLIKACALALRDHGELNGYYSDDGLTLAKEINIGVVVALKVGLIVPVVKNADSLKLKEISASVRGLRQRIMKKESTPEDLTGGTFTISNLGMFGVDEFSAIINPPQVAILAAGAVREKPAIKEGKIQKASLMNITLSADHRALDGVIVAKFVNRIKEYLENPVVLAL